MSIVQQFAEAQAVLDGLLAKLQQQIRALPDNPRIKRLEGTNAFVVSSRDLGNNWSAAHHDFKAMYEAVVGEISTGNPAHAIEKLRKIVGERMIHTAKVGRISLHPDVIHYLRSLLE